MHVDSYLELFTTMYGWAFANIIGSVLVGTGLFALPFLLLVFQSWREAKESAAGGASAVGLSEAIQVKIIIAIFVFAFAFCTTPFTTLSPGNITYTPQPTAVNPNPTPVTIGSTGTTYDQAMPQPDALSSSGSGSLSSVPMWWYLVMALSSGLNDAVRGGIANAQANLRDIAALARMAAIQDPKVLANVQLFYSQCYIPARSQYLRMDPSTLDPTYADIIAPSNTQYGPADVDWMGSHLFQTDPQFYQAMHSLTPIPGFPLDPNDPNAANVGGGDMTGSLPANGYPTCENWWTDPTAGVRAGIVGQVGSDISVVGALKAAVNVAFPGDGDNLDAVARAALINNPPSFVDATHTMGGGAGALTNVGRFVGGTAGTLFTGSGLIATFMGYMHMTAAMMMFQALTLMAIYMLLPLIVVLSGYKLEVMFYGAMAIFTVKFWSVLWFVANWIDNNLFTSMNAGNQGVMGFFNYLGNGGAYKQPILDILLFGMYLGFPLIWSAMMGWIGIKVGTALSNLLEGNAHPRAANQTGMSAEKAISKIKGH
jgi:hypothetical protein